MACLVTLERAMAAMMTEFATVNIAVGGVLALALWSLVPAAARARRLIEENPGSSIARQFSGIERCKDPSDYAEAHQLAEQRAWKKSLIQGGVGVLICVIATVVIFAQTRGTDELVTNASSPEFDSVAALWVDAWQASDMESLVDIYLGKL